MICIVYPNGTGISVVYPSGELSLIDIAEKDVPAGHPFRFVDASEVPSDDEARQNWQVDFTEPDGWGLGHDAWWAAKLTESELPGEGEEGQPA